MISKDDKLSLYLHIPFCERKCNYCDFLSAVPVKGQQGIYTNTLCREIEAEGENYKGRKVDTVFLGGGTPSLLSSGETKQIVTTLRKKFSLEKNAEITIEINPKTVDRVKLATYHELGINRLSVGLQSANDRELKELGRIHSWEDFLRTWEQIRECGFTNVNIDIMSALPGQDQRSYEDTLQKVLALRPEHISAYSLIIEDGTPFYERFSESGKEAYRLPDEEEDRWMYERTDELLKTAGYKRYEISNYSLVGYECRHNIGYWTGKEYLGLGLGASSMINNQRFQRETDLQTYLDKVERGMDTVIRKENLTRQDRMEEFMFLGLRLMEGIHPHKFEEEFGICLRQQYKKQLDKLNKEGLLYSTSEGGIALTKRGIDLSNRVFVEFLLS